MPTTEAPVIPTEVVTVTSIVEVPAPTEAAPSEQGVE